MKKPREFWLNDGKVFHTAEDGRYMQNALNIETIHVIEKSAADKLTEALEENNRLLQYIEGFEYHNEFDASTNLETSRNYASALIDKNKQALKEYRGEECPLMSLPND